MKVSIESLILYRGDQRKTPDELTSKFKSMIHLGTAKNQAGFFFFSNLLETAQRYAISGHNVLIVDEGYRTITTVDLKAAKIVEFESSYDAWLSMGKPMPVTEPIDRDSNMNIEAQKRLKKAHKQRVRKANLASHDKIKKLKARLKYKGDGALKDTKSNKSLLDRIFSAEIDGLYTPNGQHLSDNARGVVLKKWLKKNGYDGYKFREGKNLAYTYALIDDSKLHLRSKEELQKSLLEELMTSIFV